MSLRARQQNISPHRAVASSGAAGGGSFPSASHGSTGLSPGMLEFSLRLTCVRDSHQLLSLILLKRCEILEGRKDEISAYFNGTMVNEEAGKLIIMLHESNE